MIPKTIKLFFLIAGLMLSGCQPEKIKIGFLLDDFSSDRWYRDRDLFIKEATNLGCEVLVDSAMGDPDKQLAQAVKMLDKGVDVLVVIPANSDKAAAIVELSHKRNVPVISYDRLIKNCNVDYYISFENSIVGELMAEYLSKRCPVGNYAIISGPPTDNNSLFLKYGQLAVIQPLIEKGDIKIVFDAPVMDWRSDEGYTLMKEFLNTGKKVDAVLAANDALAQGVIRALEEKNLQGKVLVSGQDAEELSIRNIIAGTQTMTVYKPIEAIASAAAHTALRLAKNEHVPEANQFLNNGKRMVPSILLTSMVVNKDNINMTVVADGYLKEHNLVP